MADERGSLFEPLNIEPVQLPDAPAGGYSSLFGVSDQKAFDLDQAVSRNKRNVENALIRKLGLSPEGFVGQGLNLGVSMVSGLSRDVVGRMATLPMDAISSMALASVPETHVQAYNRWMQGAENDADMALLGQTAPGDDGIQQTYMDRLRGAQGLQHTAQGVADFFDISRIKDTTRSDRLSDDLKESTAEGVADLRKAREAFDRGDLYEAVKSGETGLLKTVGNAIVTGVQDPGATAEYVAENVPQLVAAAVNPALAVATNAGYGLDLYRKGLDDYYYTHDGKIPEAAERLRRGLFATSASVAEHVGDVSLLRGMNKVADAGRGGLVKGAGAITGAAAREGVTEGYQTYAEAQAKGTDTTLEEIVEGATIGALVGGNFQGLAQVAGKENAAIESIENNTSKDEAFTAAVTSGDVSALADVKSPTYDPVRAVNALHQNALDGDEAAVTTNLTQADQIQQALTKQVSEVQARLQESSPEAIADVREMLDTMKAAGAPQADLDYVQQIADAAEAVTPEQRQADEAEMVRLQSQLNEVQQAAERMRVDTSPEQAEVATIAQAAQAGDVQAADRLLTLTMTNPDSVDTQVAEALAQSEALSVPQRTAMRLFSEAQVAANALKGRMGVRSDIATGGDGFKGIPQYRNALRMALANGDLEAARSQVDGLASFAASRVSKLEAITAAYEQVKATELPINIVRNEQGEWGQTDLTGDALKKRGGLVIDRTSFKLRDDVSHEADVLGKTAAAFQALVEAAPSPVAAASVQAQAADQESVTPPAAEATVAQPTGESAAAPAAAAPSVEAAVAPTAGKPTQAELERADDEARIGKPALRKRLDAGKNPFVDIQTDGTGAVTVYAKGVASTQTQYQVKLEPTAAELKLIKRSEHEIELSGTQEERDAARAAQAELIRPIAERAIASTAEVTSENVQSPAEPAAQTDAGKLTALRNRTGEPVTAENYTAVNLASELFEQQAGSETDASVRPLVSVENFISKVQAGEVQLTDFIDQKEPLSGPQHNAVNSFLRYAQHSAQAIRKHFKVTETRAKRPDFFYRDMAQFLQNADGTIDENLATAVAFAQFSWVNENATQLRNSDPAINMILMRSPDTEVSNAEQAALSTVGTREPVVAARIGARVLQALGMRVNQQGTEAEQAKMEAAVGAKAIAAMVELGLAEYVQVSEATLRPLIGQAPVISELQPQDVAALQALLATRRVIGEDVRTLKTAIAAGSIGYAGVEAINRAVSGKRVPTELTKKVRAIAKDLEAHRHHTFVRVKSAPDADGRLVADPQVVRIRERNVGAQSVLSKLFSVEASGVEPSYTPVKFTQKFAKRTQQAIPKKLAKTLDKEGKRGHVVRQNMWHVWGRLSSQARYAAAGVVSTTDVPTHAENLASRQAKNDGLMQQVDNFDAFVKNMIADPATKGLEQMLYFARSVWTVQRVGLLANVINPQTSKVHRHMLAMAGWNATVDMTDKGSVANFNLRVLEAFGVKTEAKQTVNVLAGYNAVVGLPVIQAGIDALVDVLRDNDVPTNEEAIIAAVQAGGANFHSLDALVALAEQRIAQQDGKTSFETSMMGEVDGVTNGPMLSIFMLGANGFDTLNRGGFFELGSPYSQFNDYHAEDGNLDLYESSIAATLSRLMGRNPQMLAALQVITGKLQTPEGDVTSKGRKIIKQPLTALMFGSNTRKAVDGMADAFIEAIYSKMEDAAKVKSEDDMKTLLVAVNTLISNKKLKLREDMGIDVAMTTKLTDQQKEALKRSFYDLLGKPTEEALGSTYATFISRRDVLNKTAQTAFEIYNAVQEAVIESVSVTATDMPRNSKGEALRVLTREQEAQVKEIMDGLAPVLQTAMSMASNQPEAGMHMGKAARTLDGSSPFEQEVSFGGELPAVDNKGKPVKPSKSSSVSAMRSIEKDPGVRGFITSIHSLDSSIASAVYAMIEALNVHDALGVDLNNVAKVGQELNKATFNALLNYSAPQAMSNMLDEVLNGAAWVMNVPSLAARIQPKLAAIMKEREKKNRGSFASQVAAVRQVVKNADTAKLSMLAQMKAIGQYATDGGSYTVTEADRQKAADKLANVGTEFNEAAETVASELDEMANHEPEVYAAGNAAQLSADSLTTLAPATGLNTLDQVLRTAEDQLKEDVTQVMDTMVSGNKNLADAVQVVPEDRAAEVVAAAAAVTGPKLSVWGQLGKPVVQSDVNLVELLATTELTAHNLIDSLIAYSNDSFQQTVLKMVKRAVPANLPVRYVTAETGPEGAFGEGVDKSRGWYAQTGTREAIFIKSPEFVESGITPELLTHELVHAALAHLVDQHTGKQGAIGRAVSDLEALREQAAAFINNNGAMSAKYRNATKDVHELLAWGLTNQDFQREVLAAITFDTHLATRIDIEAQAADMQAKYEERFKEQNAEFHRLDRLPNMTGEQRARWEELDTLLSSISDIEGMVSSERSRKDDGSVLSAEDRATILDLRAKYRNPKAGLDTGLLNGLKRFIRNITAMLFNGSVKESSGMGLLVASAAGLFREASKVREVRETKTHKYEDAIDHVNAMTAGQVFDGLSTLPGKQVDPAHAAYLRELLEATVEPLYGPYGAFKEQAKADMAITPMDVYLKAVHTGNLPFSSGALHQAFIVSQQEAFVLESVEATIQEAMTNANTLFVRQGLENLFKEARSTLKPFNFHPGDWATATDDEKKTAKAKYDFLFRPNQTAGGKHAYLARFAALGLASQEVRNVLSFATADTTQPLKSLPWAARLTELFRRLMTRLASLHTKVTPGMAGNAALSKLVGQLVDIEAKRKRSMHQRQLVNLDSVEVLIGKAANNLRERVDVLGQSDFMRKSPIPGFKLAGVAMSTVAGNRLEALLDHATVVRDQSQKTKHGILMGLLNEYRGTHDSTKLAAELFKGAKDIEQNRKDYITVTSASVRDAFAGELSQAQSDALTKVFLRTNASAISDALGIDGLRNLLEDPAAMKAYREDLEAQVTALSGNHLYLLGQTKDLAHHKVVGGSTSANLMQNTRNIAALYGTRKAGQDAHLVKDLVPLLDQLMGVYGLAYSGSVDMKHAKEVLRTEANRQDGNGVEFILKLHSGLQKKSAALLFNGTEALQQSGYVPEIHDNKIDVLLVETSQIEAHKRAGYEVGTQLQHDPNFTYGENRVLMTRRGAGQTSINSGAYSYTGEHSKGSSPVAEAKNMMAGTQTTSAAMRQQIARSKAQAIDALFHRGPDYDPRTAQYGHMAPTLAPDGRIADYRYLMTEQNRDALLYRDNSVDQVLGVMAGQIVDKVDSAQQNADVTRSLYDQYKADYNNRPSSYLMVGEDSTDPQLAELYRLLSEKTRQEIRRVWKGNNMFIPADQIDLIMGYRKYSLTEPFSALPSERNLFEKALVAIATAVWGEKAELRVGQGEDLMQWLVRQAKDIIVVKSIVTAAFNILSNMTLLAWQGVSLKKAAASHAIAIKGALDYRRDNKRLIHLTTALDIGYLTDSDAVESELVEIRDRMARNPIKPLIDAGLLPTIVEDVEVDDDRYSYSARIQQKTEKYTSKVPSWLRTVGKQAYVTHDTGFYKFLSQTTQLSDLVARYALYEHLTTRQKDPMSQSDALVRAEQSFVNYDLPSHRSVQFLNDMGIFMFTKYYIRIQKVIMQLVREHPARGLMLAAANHYFTGLQSVMDSSWLNHVGNNPLNPGALGYLGALGELPAIKLLD